MYRFVFPIFMAATFAAPACATSPSPKTIAASTVLVSQASLKTIPTPRIKPDLDAQSRRFTAWKADFKARAIAKGYSASLVNSLIDPVRINPLALERDKTQPEFTKPIWNYVELATNKARLETGRSKLTENARTLQEVESRYRVSQHVLTAIWGLETSYGRIMGDHDVPSALATFAFEGRRTKFGEEQLFAVLDILQSRAVTRKQLIGSWAGAMGNTQFIPTTFRDYAVDFDGDSRKDLWASKADALGSAAHYLSRSGWRYGEPTFAEVTLPANFDYALANGSSRNIADWNARGVKPINGQNWTQAALGLDTKLIIPAGAKGPAILTFKNFDVIKRYNNSTSYALGISMLAESLAGRPVLQTPWPKSDKPVAFSDLKRMQKKLTSLGYNTQGADGIIGPNTRKAIQAWQVTNGLPADGYIEAGMFKKIMNSAR